MDLYRIDYQLKAPGSFIRAYVEKRISVAAGSAFGNWLASPTGATRKFEFDGFLSLPASTDVRKFIIDHDAVIHFMTGYTVQTIASGKTVRKASVAKPRSPKSAA